MIKRIQFLPFESEEYPFNIPSIKNTKMLDLSSNITVLVGNNGSGKSTLIDLIMGLDFNFQGKKFLAYKKKFNTIEMIKNANIEELTEIDGVGLVIAESLNKFLNDAVNHQQIIQMGEFGLSLEKDIVKIDTENEYFGIKLTDGLYDEDNEKYFKVYDTSKYLKSNIQYIMHWADHMSCRIESSEYKNGIKF